MFQVVGEEHCAESGSQTYVVSLYNTNCQDDRSLAQELVWRQYAHCDPAGSLKVGLSSRSGQVRSEGLTCTLRASCCRACLSQARVLAFARSSVRDRIFLNSIFWKSLFVWLILQNSFRKKLR